MWPFNSKVPEVKSVKKHDLHNTYFVVSPDMDMAELVAIQWWLKEEGLYTSGRMPVAEILSLAERRGSACVLIKEDGEIDYSGGCRYPGFRESTIYTGLKVVNYEVAPATIQVLGDHYDAEELREALSKLETK